MHRHYCTVILFHINSKLPLQCQFEFCFKNVIWCKLQETCISEKLSYEHLTVFAGLNQVSVGLNRFKPHVWQKQVFASRNSTVGSSHTSFM